MLLTIWINAFIPRTVAGYTKTISRGTHSGKTAVPLPGVARLNPLNAFKNWDSGFLTDQRGFDSNIKASVRMRSIATLTIAPPKVTLSSTRHESSGTTEVDMDTGNPLDFAVADMTRCRWGTLNPVQMLPIRMGTVRVPFGGSAPLNIGMRPNPTPTFTLAVRGQAGDPLVSAAADIDYVGTFTIALLAGGGTPAVVVEFEGRLDEFPAFEAYARLGTQTKTLFTSSPPAGNTVVDLLGGPKRPVAGRVSFP
jgi:hypothetical protein